MDPAEEGGTIPPAGLGAPYPPPGAAGLEKPAPAGRGAVGVGAAPYMGAAGACGVCC
jgi:hypothetical protein